MKRSIKYFNYCKLREVGSIFPTKQGIRIRISFFAKYQRGWNWDNYFSSKLRAAKVKKRKLYDTLSAFQTLSVFPFNPFITHPFFLQKKGEKKLSSWLLQFFRFVKKPSIVASGLSRHFTFFTQALEKYVHSDSIQKYQKSSDSSWTIWVTSCKNKRKTENVIKNGDDNEVQQKNWW